jgi:hypothetical protein
MSPGEDSPREIGPIETGVQLEIYELRKAKKQVSEVLVAMALKIAEAMDSVDIGQVTELGKLSSELRQIRGQLAGKDSSDGSDIKDLLRLLGTPVRNEAES